MTNEALEALKQSIAHWERMESGTYLEGEEPYEEHCALCRAFNLEAGMNCRGCPVAEAGHRNCVGSPYMRAEAMFANHGIASVQFKIAAREEIEFLKSLLPKEGL